MADCRYPGCRCGLRLFSRPGQSETGDAFSIHCQRRLRSCRFSGWQADGDPGFDPSLLCRAVLGGALFCPRAPDSRLGYRCACRCRGVWRLCLVYDESCDRAAFQGDATAIDVCICVCQYSDTDPHYRAALCVYDPAFRVAGAGSDLGIVRGREKGTRDAGDQAGIRIFVHAFEPLPVRIAPEGFPAGVVVVHVIEA